MAVERQAKDGTVYEQVAKDEWLPITRKAKDGTVYKKMGKDSWMPMETPAPKEKGFIESAGEAARGFGEGVAKSATLGTLPYIKAGVEAAADKVGEKFLGFPQDQSTFEERVDRARAQGKDVSDKAPIANLAGEVTGFFIPGAAATKAVGAGFKALAASRLPGVARAAGAIAEGSSLAAKSAQVAAEGAALGAAYTPESGFTDIDARLDAAGTGAAFGAIIPPGLKGASKVLEGAGAAGKAAIRGVGTVGKKMLSSLGGVSEDVIERYLQDPTRIRSAKSFDELYEGVSGIVARMGDDLENAKINHESAAKHLDEVAAEIKNSRMEGREKALEVVNQAKATLDEAFSAQKQSLQSKASPSAAEPAVSGAIDNLKNKVSQGSAEAFDTLGNSKVSISEPYKAVVAQTQDLANRGSDAAARAVQKLKQYSEILFNKGTTNAAGGFEANASAIKKTIQDIDSDIGAWNQAGGSFDDAYNSSLKTLRRALDEQLKSSNPQYRAKMATVADDARLLGKASQSFGKPERALSRLGNLERAAAKYDAETLRELAKREGGDLPRQVEELIAAQKTLKSPTRMDSLKQALPETQKLRAAEMEAAAAKRLSKPKLVKQAIEKSAASFKAQSTKAQFEAKKQLFNRFKSFGEQGAESKLRQVALGKKHAEKVLRELSEYADEDLVEAVKAAQDSAAFDKTMFNGSRNVNLWSVLGALGQSFAGKGGAGAATGGIIGGPVGMAVGGVTGAMIDVYGPKLTKQILDQVIRVKGPMNEMAISKFALPEKVKLELLKAFKTSVIGQNVKDVAEGAIKSVASQDQKPLKGEAKWVADGYARLSEHANKSGAVIPRSESLNSQQAKGVLMGASGLEPGSPEMEKVLEKIKKLEGTR